MLSKEGLDSPLTQHHGRELSEPLWMKTEKKFREDVLTFPCPLLQMSYKFARIEITCLWAEPQEDKVTFKGHLHCQ